MAPHLGGQKPNKKQFWGVNRRFQAKLTTLGSAVPVILLEPPKFCNGSHDLTRPPTFVSHGALGCELDIKFVVFAITNYEDA